MRKFLIFIVCVFMSCAAGCAKEEEITLGGGDTYYTVTFLQGDSRTERRVKAGEALQNVPQIEQEKTGYTAKWSVEDFTRISEDVTVTVIYTPVESTIFYDLGECRNAVIESLCQTVRYDEAFSLYVPYAEEADDYEYVFVKWVDKTTDEEFTGGVCDFTADVQLIAVWEKFTPSFPI
ncbi:MAG: hypothetical protein ACI4RO_05140 [Candidatus Scatosoma sp.]